MKKLLIVGATAISLLLFTAGTAAADEHDHEEVPLHPHALLVGTGGDEVSGFTAVACIELANNQSLPLNAHHDHIHTGAAGFALFTNTNHFAVPLAPFTEWEDCDDLIETFGITIVRGGGNLR